MKTYKISEMIKFNEKKVSKYQVSMQFKCISCGGVVGFMYNEK